MVEKEKRKRQPNQGKWVIAIVFAGVSLMACSYGFLGARLDQADFLSEGGCIGNEPYQHDIINAAAKITLPASTANLEAYSESWQDCFILLKFEMSAEDAEAFYASTLVESFEEVRGADLSFGGWVELEDFWVITEDRIYLHGEGNEGNLFQQVAIDTSNPDVYTVYVAVLTT
jgi:hypothetical protein